MKVRFLKPLLQHQPGDEIEVDAARGEYWKRVGIAEEVEEGEKKKNAGPQPSEKKDDAGPAKKAAKKRQPKKK